MFRKQNQKLDKKISFGIFWLALQGIKRDASIVVFRGVFFTPVELTLKNQEMFFKCQNDEITQSTIIQMFLPFSLNILIRFSSQVWVDFRHCETVF